MANAISKFKKYIDTLDEVYKVASVTSVLDGNNRLVRMGANANEIIAKAQKDGREIKLAAIKYADDLLERVETDVKIVNEKIKQCREGLRQ